VLRGSISAGGLGDKELTMSNHLGSREVDVLLRDGSSVHVCPAKPSDAPAVKLLLKGLSDRSRWLRFFSAFPDLARAARWATEVDNDRRTGSWPPASGMVR
jgi:hypothetical protein